MIAYKEFEEIYLNVGVKEAIEQLFISNVNSNVGLGDERIIEISNHILDKTPFKVSRVISINNSEDPKYIKISVKHVITILKEEVCLREFNLYVDITGDLYYNIISTYNTMKNNISNAMLYGISTVDDYFDEYGKPIISIHPLDAAVALKDEYIGRNVGDRSNLDFKILNCILENKHI